MFNKTIREFVCTEDVPVVQTDKGKVRGYMIDGTYTFRGIRYARAKRFMPPEPVEEWDGIIDAHDYGYICPEPGRPEPYQDFLLPRRHWPDSEDCQYLNIWTQSLTTDARRPVMVWLHGGGFFAGSSLDLFAYEGEELSRAGDVVVVTLNHRLNLLGFMDLSDYGDQYKDSGNVGMADIIFALKWVRENIDAFGGDPDNVTIFGQSGGGGKVSTLLQMPSADGLYHRAIIQSGVLNNTIMRATKAGAMKKTEKIVERLGLTRDTIKQIERLPYRILADAANALALEQTGVPVSVEWAPVPGESYAGDPMDVGFRKESAHIPMIVGSVLKEFLQGPVGNKAQWSDEQRMAAIRERAGGRTEEIRCLFEQAYPEMDVSYAQAVDTDFRLAAEAFVNRRIRECCAPVYNYIFTFESAFKGGMLIGHSCEIPFVFHNAGFTETCCKSGITERLQEEVSQAWIHFAYSGNPNHKSLPLWKPYSKDEGCCMALGDVTVLKTGHFDRNLVKSLKDIFVQSGRVLL